MLLYDCRTARRSSSRHLGVDPFTVFPTRITDAQGNSICIGYRRPDRAPEISIITDTLGRTVRFYYDTNQL